MGHIYVLGMCAFVVAAICGLFSKLCNLRRGGR